MPAPTFLVAKRFLRWSLPMAFDQMRSMVMSIVEDKRYLATTASAC